MEVLRAILACIFRRRWRNEQGCGEVLYDDKMAALYSDSEPYNTPRDVMSYYFNDADDHDGDGTAATLPVTHADKARDTAIPAADTRTVEEIAREVARLLWQAEWNDDALQGRISEAVGERRWNRRMVEACLDRVIEYVERGRGAGMGAAMSAALDQATDVADDEFAFPRRHPPSLDGFIAIVSVGVLADLLGAWVLELLGFGEVRGKEELEGSGEIAMLTSDKIVFSATPKPGSVAAWWVREYGAYIPSGSIYSYLQRMDMVEVGE
ncbi:9266c4dc-067a-45ca-93a2-cc3570234438 [Thermothielavioides terrestris]|jgi:hypothetical protein|uniref:Uncharacterized protein n=2 Tax=Thermothielavioides terrestris TaxID=2587410 RepID=G2QUF8_THETT|nr:uncharacterized protein THITE_2037751 [Thermothielavioides terrestris NRRL 8126]AEO63710.1 hypothetical protein THITE_2037751 [Thermothielavioides terrestris NRRL 8126]SPQ20787.1 9266c4dc-067a-45ca-93a2-cc3570234438 [Thermothielavioides terrestris]